MINWNKLHKIAGKSNWKIKAKKRQNISKETRKKHIKLALKILDKKREGFSGEYVAKKLHITIDELNSIIHGDFIFTDYKVDKLLKRIFEK